MTTHRLQLGYSVTALPDHRITDAIRLLSDIGYECMGVRLNRRDFRSTRVDYLTERIRQLHDAAGHRTLIIETDGKYLLDRDHAEEPSLIDADPESRARRERLIARTIQAAAPARAIVTCTSGIRPLHEDQDRLLDRLAESLRRLARFARRHRVKLALRPATGQLISRVAHFERLLQWLPKEPIYLAADVPAMVRGGELPVASLLGRDPHRLACVFVADVGDEDGVDLPPGAGHLHWPALFAGIRSATWSGPVCVRCHATSEPAPEVAGRVHAILSSIR